MEIISPSISAVPIHISDWGIDIVDVSVVFKIVSNIGYVSFMICKIISVLSSVF